MRLRHIEIFHAIMVSGSVNAAARMLNVTQPAVTKMLQHAEDQLRFKLFTRLKGRLVATQEAHVLYSEVEKLYACLDSVRVLAQQLRSGGAGRMRIAAPPALCEDIVPVAVSLFRDRYPEIPFDIRTAHYEEAISAILRQEVDIAIVFDPQPHPALAIERIAQTEFVACLPSHCGAFPERIALADLANMPFIALSARDPIGLGVLSALQQAKIELSIAIEVKTNALALAFVRRGAGATIIDAFTASRAPDSIVRRRLATPLSLDVGVVTLRNASRAVAIDRFIATLRSEMARSELVRV